MNNEQRSIKVGEMIKAVEEGNIAKIKELAKEDQSLVNVRNESGLTMLHLAAQVNAESAAALLDKNADKRARESEFGQCPLHWAIKYNNNRAMEHIVQINPCAQELEDELKNLILQDNDGNTPLHIGAMVGNAEAIKLIKCRIVGTCELISVRTSELIPPLTPLIDAQNRRKETPLHLAADGNSKKVIDNLFEHYGPGYVESSPNVNMLDGNGNTPRDRAFAKEHYAIAEQIRNQGGEHSQDL